MKDETNSDAAETSLLGHLIATPERLRDVPEALQPFHFYSEAHRWIFAAVRNVTARGDVATLAAVDAELKRLDRKRTVGERMADVLREAVGNGSPKEIASLSALVLEMAARRVVLDGVRRVGAELEHGRVTASAATERLRTLGDGVPPAETAAPPWAAHWQPLAADTFAEPPARRAWLLDKVLPLGKVGMLTAEGGAGKTTALCQLALAVATGEPWLGTFQVHPDAVGRVLLVLGEEDAEEVRRRMWHAARALRLDRGRLELARQRIVTLPLAGVPCSFLEHDRTTGTRDSAFAEWLRGKLAEPGEPWRLVVLDPLSRFAGADAETDNAAATRFVQSVEAIASLTGASALVAHHTNKTARDKDAKASTAAARGSSALTDGARWVAQMTSEDLTHDDAELRAHLDRVVTLRVTKSNYAMRPPDVVLRHDRENGGALLPCDDIDRAAISEARKRPEKGSKSGVATAAAPPASRGLAG